MKTPNEWRDEISKATGIVEVTVDEIEAIQLDATQELKATCAALRYVVESAMELAPEFLDNEAGHFSKLCERVLANGAGKELLEWCLESRKALEKLAVLGNGLSRGNSIGNQIAQEVIDRIPCPLHDSAVHAAIQSSD